MARFTLLGKSTENSWWHCHLISSTKISSIRERDDINDMSIKRLYGKLKNSWNGARAKAKSSMDQGTVGQQEYSPVEKLQHL